MQTGIYCRYLLTRLRKMRFRFLWVNNWHVCHLAINTIIHIIYISSSNFLWTFIFRLWQIYFIFFFVFIFYFHCAFPSLLLITVPYLKNRKQKIFFLRYFSHLNANSNKANWFNTVMLVFKDTVFLAMKYDWT